jgi:predicted nucleotidyltransferase
VAEGLASLVESTKQALGPDLVAIVLFGSAAEGRLRATSDVNLIIVATRFDRERFDALREPLRLARALFRLSTMLMLDSELPAAAEAFAVKFADIRARHRLLAGTDPFLTLAPTRAAMIMRLKQVLLNFILRTRERYALLSLREEQLVPLVADAAGPLRSAAALMLQLEGRPAGSPKAALELLAAELQFAGADALLGQLSAAREAAVLPAGVAPQATLQLIVLAQRLHARAQSLS